MTRPNTNLRRTEGVVLMNMAIEALDNVETRGGRLIPDAVMCHVVMAGVFQLGRIADALTDIATVIQEKP